LNLPFCSFLPVTNRPSSYHPPDLLLRLTIRSPILPPKLGLPSNPVVPRCVFLSRVCSGKHSSRIQPFFFPRYPPVCLLKVLLSFSSGMACPAPPPPLPEFPQLSPFKSIKRQRQASFPLLAPPPNPPASGIRKANPPRLVLFLLTHSPPSVTFFQDKDDTKLSA